MHALFHILTRAAWDQARAAGVYRPASLATEGFIHLSTASQWPRTLVRVFAGVTDLVLLEIDPVRAGDVRHELADGELFPHLYGPLAIAAVIRVRDV